MTPTELESVLRELARVRSGSEPIVSLYLDVRWTDEQQRERVRLFVQEAIRRALVQYRDGTPGRDALERTFGRVREWVAGLIGQAHETGHQGVALFACESLGLWRPLAFSRPVENDLATDAVPHLMQLAGLARDAAPVLVAVPGREGAALFSVRLGDVELDEDVRSPAPRGERDELETGATRLAGGEGPTSRYERTDKDMRHEVARVQRNQRAAAARLVALLDARPAAVVVLVGPSRTTAAFERELPERVRARVIARVPRPRGWASADGARKDAVLGVAAKAHEASRAREGRTPDRLVGEALRGGIAVVGPEDVALALTEGRVHGLVLEEDFERAGWRCDNCDALGANAESAEACPFCGGELHVVHDLAEALVARTLAVGGTVDVVPREKRLHGYGGVGAFLRQTAPTGLRGASPPWTTAPGATQP
jgi:peptide subunit release factor 1 (eRF1)